MAKIALITGGSSGIGFEMSRCFARNGYSLLWVSRFPEELEIAKGEIQAEFPDLQLEILVKDLSNLSAPTEVHQWTLQNNWKVEVLINNAGVGTHGYLTQTDFEKEKAMIQLNVLCMFQLTRLYLDEMVVRDSGTIINISSNSSFQPVARMVTYSSTKAFVTHFTRGLQEELSLQHSKVKAITVCPSAINDTAFQAAAKMEKVKTFKGLAFTTAKEVASDVWKGFQKGKTFIVTGAKMRALYAIRGLVPYGVQQYMVRKETEIEK